jgi:hypothetical protein
MKGKEQFFSNPEHEAHQWWQHAAESLFLQIVPGVK